ncbi:MAG: protein TolR [Thiomargarita sp.]|nr:protein TolR [Thiomargarita sp.]
MSNYRKRHRRISDINVVPYIDIMLVLLIIFMITSPLLHQSIEVDLPVTKQSNNIGTSKTQFIVVTIDAQKQLFLDEEPLALTRIQLLTRVIALSRFTPNSQVLIRGDKLLAYGEIVKLMSLLQEAGIEKVGLLTKPSLSSVEL